MSDDEHRHHVTDLRSARCPDGTCCPEYYGCLISRSVFGAPGDRRRSRCRDHSCGRGWHTGSPAPLARSNRRNRRQCRATARSVSRMLTTSRAGKRDVHNRSSCRRSLGSRPRAVDALQVHRTAPPTSWSTPRCSTIVGTDDERAGGIAPVQPPAGSRTPVRPSVQRVADPRATARVDCVIEGDLCGLTDSGSAWADRRPSSPWRRRRSSPAHRGTGATNRSTGSRYSSSGVPTWTTRPSR